MSITDTPTQPDRLTRLLLRNLTLDRVDFVAILESGDQRQVSVVVQSHRSAPTWRKLTRFPHCHDESGLGFDDPADDALVLDRVAEELVRLSSSIEVVRAAA